MDVLLPGYPKNNPILKGIAAVAGGADLQQALEARDRALPTPFKFASAALEAVCWLDPASPLVEGLSTQATMAFGRTDQTLRSPLLSRASVLADAGHLPAQALLVAWTDMESSL